MTYQVWWDPRTEDDLRRIGREGAKRVLAAVTEKLTIDPRRGKPLKADVPRWSFRVGVYRVLYFFSENKLVIWTVRVGHRKNVYWDLNRLEPPEEPETE